jgi:hypothetical protein
MLRSLFQVCGESNRVLRLLLQEQSGRRRVFGCRSSSCAQTLQTFPQCSSEVCYAPRFRQTHRGPMYAEYFHSVKKKTVPGVNASSDRFGHSFRAPSAY